LNTEPIRLLIIEDEAPIRRLIKASYGPTEAHVFEADTAEEGLRATARHNPEVILLDLGLPDQDGQEVCRQIREWSQTPIIVLSARGQERDKVAALDNGADDYITKPFNVGELQARIRAALRHGARLKTQAADVPFERGNIRIDVGGRLVFKGGVEVHLTPNEFKLLALLVRHAGMVLTHRQLLEEVWGPAYADELHYLRVYMGQLRHKLEDDPARPQLIRTESGVGYRLLVDG